jgi:hypothetical protein
MPPIELEARYEKAVLWEPPSSDIKQDDYGASRITPPAEVRVQWVTDKRRIQDVFGTTVNVDAMAVVAQEVKVGSLMWLGELADWTGTGSGGQDDEVMKVVSSSTQRDIKGRVTRRTVALQKFGDDVPATV